jgi:hypothetical protein
MHFVTSVQYESGYKLRLGFEDGAIKVVDLEKHLDGEVFEPLRNLSRFRSARLNADLDTVVWDNGADMSPDFLYEIGAATEEAPSRKVAEGRPRYSVSPKKPG